MEPDKLMYEYVIYYGGKNGDGIYITKPTFYDHTTGETKLLYPNEARLKNLTYGVDIFYDIEILYSMKNINTGKYIYQNEKSLIQILKIKFILVKYLLWLILIYVF